MLRSYVQRAEVLLPLALLLIIGNLAFFVQTARASYSCPLSSEGCHGVVVWPGTNTGAQTEAQVITMSCPAPACDPVGSELPHIGNVLWVLDANNHQSSCPDYGVCWIEAGYHTVTGYHANGCTSDGVWYYWADWRPGDQNENVHCFGAVASGDLGYNVWLYIAANGGNQWTIQVSPQTNYWSGLSKENSMSADNIEIGMEPEGTSGLYLHRRKDAYLHADQSVVIAWFVDAFAGCSSF